MLATPIQREWSPVPYQSTCMNPNQKFLRSHGRFESRVARPSPCWRLWSCDQATQQGMCYWDQGRLAIPFQSGEVYSHLPVTFQSGENKGGTLCLAGQDEFPYEETATQSPRWLRTVGASMPWHEPPAFIERLCHDQADPASVFHGDPWHGLHLGIGKAFVASTAHLCLRLSHHARTLELKWPRPWLSEHYFFLQREEVTATPHEDHT